MIRVQEKYQIMWVLFTLNFIKLITQSKALCYYLILILLKNNFKKSQQVYKHYYLFFALEEKTLIFDFDETLAKVSFDKFTVKNYEEQIDILTKRATHNVNFGIS